MQPKCQTLPRMNISQNGLMKEIDRTEVWGVDPHATRHISCECCGILEGARGHPGWRKEKSGDNLRERASR